MERIRIGIIKTSYEAEWSRHNKNVSDWKRHVRVRDKERGWSFSYILKDLWAKIEKFSNKRFLKMATKESLITLGSNENYNRQND